MLGLVAQLCGNCRITLSYIVGSLSTPPPLLHRHTETKNTVSRDGSVIMKNVSFSGFKKPNKIIRTLRGACLCEPVGATHAAALRATLGTAPSTEIPPVRLRDLLSLFLRSPNARARAGPSRNSVPHCPSPRPHGVLQVLRNASWMERGCGDVCGAGVNPYHGRRG